MQGGRRLQVTVLGLWALLALAGGVELQASNPRWVTGPPYFTTSGQPVIWFTDTPQYYTDSGDLSVAVKHAAADALVAAAAGAWNVPTSRLVIGRGGGLDEHVSGANIYLGQNGIVFPADVQAGNAAGKQIAVIYDRDGSVTDLLLGSGASDPSGCRQNGVTESVDSISADGLIRHAVLVLNGRCTGSAPEMQLQLQYQLMRAFGRVLGMGWSQTNDNVFTGTPVPTHQQALHWPVMHPIDVICGPYTYQCMPQPFTLRNDDLAGMAQLYYIPQGQAVAGKTDSLLNANRIAGRIYFPTGQPMQGVNVVGRRLAQFRADSDTETWDSVSSVSGALFRRENDNAVNGKEASVASSMGSTWNFYEGWYLFSRVPMLPGFWQWIVVETEPVNPLYVGPYSVGPYTTNTVQPSGNATVYKAGIMGSYSDYEWFDFNVDSAAASCTVPGGSESAPLPVDGSGWWTAQLCGYGQTAWAGFTVKANRSLTVEVTAEDEAGSATSAKAMPVIGLWRATDALGSAPAMAATDALNGVAAGMTSLALSGMPAGALRLAVADRRGDGRPDYNFGGRVLYADAVTPSSLGAGGGMVTITGMGFRAGNAVTVNGVAAAVQSWSATSIVARMPAARALGGSSAGLVADVAVRDLSTGGLTVMTGALSYAAPLPEVMTLVSAPAGTVTTGHVTSPAFAVRVTEADGMTPVVGETVTFSVSAGSVVLGACAGGICTVVTDTRGLASTTVTPLAAGAAGLLAVGDTTRASASFTVADAANVLTLVSAPSGVVYVGDVAAARFAVRLLKADGVTPVAGAAVVFSGSGAQFGSCGTGSCTALTDATGLVSTAVTPTAAGPVVLTAGAGAGVGAVTASFTAMLRVRTATMVRTVEYVAEGSSFVWLAQVVLADNSGPVAGQGVAWVGGPGLSVGSGASLADASGIASLSVTVGPLSAGAGTAGTGCGWVATVCAGFSATGVAAGALQVEVVSGAGQAIASDGMLGRVSVQVTDGLGHAVAGAEVDVHQTVESGVACPAQGRCPAEAVLLQGQSQGVSDGDGMVLVTPLQVAGTEVTNMVVTAGTQGFAALVLTKGW